MTFRALASFFNLFNSAACRYYSIGECNHDGQRNGGLLDAAVPTEPFLAGYYATIRVVIQLDDDGKCFRQVDTKAAGMVQKDRNSGLLVVPPSQALVPYCWCNAEISRPSVADAAKAQTARAFEVWRWTDAFEKLVDRVGGAANRCNSAIY